ncbi:MAG TPA: hypothetical protein VG271_18165 [Beijerinckiaceae bacterium]|jgi:hypothetical protein|nr:hypothetical protein [Beijerinckiaceae bacterium]
MAWSDVEEDEEVRTSLAGTTLQSILHFGGRAAAQAWGMKLLESKSADAIRQMCAHWPPEVLEFMAEKLVDDERFG